MADPVNIIKHKVLIAEDESLIASVIARKLEVAGFEAKTASNGQQALDILLKEKFDMMLLDLTMPDVDGFEVLAKLKERGSTMPVIVMSNLSQPEDVKKAKELGAWNYVTKANVEPKQVVEIVKQCILEHNC